MKNREKYREQILNYEGTMPCEDIIESIILKTYGKTCGEMKGCDICRLIQAIWMEEECQEPEVDWSKVKKDTPIYVGHSQADVAQGMYKRYFAKFEDGYIYAYADGRASWTADDRAIKWEYAKLAEVPTCD